MKVIWRRYFKERQRDKLYRDWVRYSELPSDAVPKKEAKKPLMITVKNVRVPLLYLLLGLGVVILLVGLLMLLFSTC